jgi:hypothetical protein
MRVLSNWRSVRLWESAFERGLHRRHSLRTHGLLRQLLGALLCAVLLGLAIDHFLPQANSLPAALRALTRDTAEPA